MWDVIVVGARCSGSSTAMLLARAGHRVLVVDRATFPSDVVSTHFLWPHGASYLNRWGLLDDVLAVTPSHTSIEMVTDGIPLSGTVPLPLLERYFDELHGDDHGVVQTYTSVRRRVLDQILIDAADAAGAEVRTGFTVDELLFDDEQRVIGVRGHGRDGETVEEHARIVVGADGRNSFVARTLDLPKFDERPRCTFAYWSYYEGTPVEHARLHRRGRLAMASVPTNFGQTMNLVYGPSEWAAAFRRDIAGNFAKAVDFISPEIGAELRSAQRVERFYGTLDQSAYLRPLSGPGWVLVGDAESFKDQCTAMGMTHAFRDAELVSAALCSWLGGDQPLEIALKEYEARRRSQSAAAYYDYVCTLAEMRPPRHEELRMFLALRDNQAETDRFLATHGDVAPLSDFFEASNLFLLDGGMRESSSRDYPIFDDFEATSRMYRRNPFIEP
ncbi:2-polyprenyl-6-methoxyphenol hydroxylase-like FAD-dependent oxidoreductase [Allocatelliglobosispora scoriae]|uniref:2-polyprenyl-6-methoxyphenol hydroxylase-like FAD-dependent oxidoreductase n=1 Tax=Allocatelliglobosispora scoriae TaxID=643052 RepID=A0A841C183_9ACTN|nr:NAD(P)/FAD-dependent oxidoreductase [Allocatelliglobosispora scoriae]MBB5873498.1 2-polyprenyl-6-methoxyphenol hydroxylase-like FAD-dependent oxidoreductase [Allocatelliglobosispora scoriae]